MPKNKPGARNLFLVSETYSELQSLLSQEPPDLFISFAIFGTGVLAFECCLKSLMSDAVYGLRVNLFFLRLISLLSSGTRASRSGGLLVFEKNSHLAEFF